MKKILFLIGFWLLAGNVAKAQKSPFSVLPVAFYNMENFFDCINDSTNAGDDEFTPEGTYHYTEEVYKQKLHNIATLLQQLGTQVNPGGAAIIGCAEIENDKVLQDLITQPEIKDRHYRFVHFDSHDERGIDVAMIYNPAYFTLIDAHTLPVDMTGTGGKENTRDVLSVCGILGGDTIYVLINHWPSRRGGPEASESKRIIAASVNRHYTDSILSIKPKAKILILGDLNDNPDNTSVSTILRAKGNKSILKPSDLYNPWFPFYQNGQGTVTFNNKWYFFDQIILSGFWLKSKSWHLYKAEIYNPDFLKEIGGAHSGFPLRSFDYNRWLNGYSDHFPVVVYLEK